jgi:hypothetical protein
VEDVGIREQVLTSVRLHRLLKKAFSSESVPVVVMEHLLRIVEFLDVLCQAVFCSVDLATGVTYQWCCRCNVTVLSSEIPFSQQHGQLSPNDAPMILGKGD